MDWNEENIERLKALYAEGHSFSLIARELGQGCTRNGALGKAHRLGLTGDRQVGKSVHPENRPEKRAGGGVAAVSLKPKRTAPLPKPAAIAAPAAVLDQGGQPITMRTVGSKQCRWYVAQESGADGQLCANATDGGPWCPHHADRLRNATAMQQLRRSLNAVPTVKARALKHA